MPELQPLHRDHAAALLAFERENRAYFAASVPDRGDDYFTDFHARLDGLLAEQAAGLIFMHVLVDRDGAVLGRVNLVEVAGGSAELGYRIAEKAAGRGLATAAVVRVCEWAVTRYGLTSLRADATLDNPASLAVLARTGFRPVGEVVLNGRPGVRHTRSLPVQDAGRAQGTPKATPGPAGSGPHLPFSGPAAT
jgi:[ribosomal protein S5]-alanine N-acetyltransferase